MDQAAEPHHLTDLILLQMSDKVQRRALIGALGVLLQHLLHPVFPADVHARPDRRPDRIRVVHLGRRHQQDFRRISARFPGRLRDFRLNMRYVFPDLFFRHTLSSPSNASSTRLVISSVVIRSASSHRTSSLRRNHVSCRLA